MTDPSQEPDEPIRDARTGSSAAAARIHNQTQWVELQLQQARDRGDFDDLPGYGRPIRDLGTTTIPIGGSNGWSSASS